MASGLDKVQAGVHAVVDNLLTVHAILLLQIRIKAGLDILNNRLPAKITINAKIASEIQPLAPLFVVDEVAKTRGINDSQAKANTILFDVWNDIKVGKSDDVGNVT